MIVLVATALAVGQASFDAGNAAYAAGDLPAAEAGYRAAIADGAIDVDAFFNLGNVLWRQEKLAPALLAWRCAGELAPRDPDVEANLAFARRNVVDRLDPIRPVPVWAPWQAAFTPAEGQWLGAAVAGVGLLVVALRRRFTHLPLVPLGVLASVFGLILGYGALAQGRMAKAAVVIAAQTTARSDIGGGVDLFTLHVGAEVVTIEQAGGHVLISLPDDRKGWVPRADLGLVDAAAPFPT